MKLVVLSGVLIGGCVPPPQYPAIVRDDRVTETAAVDGVPISATPMGAAGWKFSIKNDTDAAVKVLWDESDFVASTGETAGRLFSGETRRIDAGHPQPPAVVPPHASANESAFAQKLVGIEFEENALHKRFNNSAAMITVEQVTEAHRKIGAIIAGGQIHLTIEVGGEKKTWSGAIK